MTTNAPRLHHNPCQGCEAYYTREGLLMQCVLDHEGACSWIKIYREGITTAGVGVVKGERNVLRR